MVDIALAPRLEDPNSDVEPLLGTGYAYRIRPSSTITGGQWVLPEWPARNGGWLPFNTNMSSVTLKLDANDVVPYELQIRGPRDGRTVILKHEFRRVTTGTTGGTAWKDLTLVDGPMGEDVPTGTVAATFADIFNQLAHFEGGGATHVDNVTGISTFARTVLDDTTAGAARTTLGAAASDNAVFTGTVTIPDAALAIADTNGLQAALDAKAPLASPTFTGTPAVPTATAGTTSTQAASTAFVDTSFAKKASPTFTGTPAAPTAAPGTNTTQLATMAAVTAAVAGVTVADASATVKGIVELATDAEATTGTDTARAVTPAGVTAVVDAMTPATIGAQPAFTGSPVEGAVLAYDGDFPVWVVPEAVTSADIPHGSDSVETVLMDILSRLAAVETTGPRLTSTVLPAISGTPEVGLTVTASAGTWTQTPDSVLYQWKRAGVDISGATSSTYVLQVADVGTGSVTVRVTATKAGFTDGVATSAAITVTDPVEASVASFTTGYADSAINLTISKPSGVANGDVLVAVLRSTLNAGATDWISSSGGTWSRIGPAWPGASSAARVVGFYARVVTDSTSEPSSYLFEHNGGAGRRVGVILLLRGLNSSFVDVAVTDYLGTSITNGRRTASLTVTGNDRLQIFAGTSDFSTMTEVPTTTPSGFTLITTVKTSASAPSSRTYIWVGSRMVDSGATGTSDIAWSAGAIDPVAQSIVFKPA